MRIIIQAGHSGRTSGATGAPGEMAFNIDVSDKVANELRGHGFDVRRVAADPPSDQISGDWDLFLAIHFDADSYGSGGGFLDRPASDGVAQRSKEILEAIEESYFKETGIANKPSRRNKNTSNYYMWSKLSLKTPCVLIECGVGQHKPDDYEVLFNKRNLVVKGIVNGILKAFSVRPESNQMSDLLAYLGVVSEAKAKERLREHLGEKTENEIVKCNWGAEGDNGGYLGSARKEITQLKTQNSQDPKVDYSKWEEDGLRTERQVGDTKIVTNYKKK